MYGLVQWAVDKLEPKNPRARRWANVAWALFIAAAVAFWLWRRLTGSPGR